MAIPGISSIEPVTGPFIARTPTTFPAVPTPTFAAGLANQLVQNTTATVIPAATETVVQPTSTVVTVSTPATGIVIPPVTNEAVVPDTTLDETPDTTLDDISDTTQSIIPPISAFNLTAGETLEINPPPVEDLSGMGNHGEVIAVMPPQPAFNNAAAESNEAKFKNNALPSIVPSTGKRPRDYLRTLNKRARATDLAFKRQHLPYQFEVLADGDKNIYIDLSILDEKGNVIKHEKRDVTNDNFGRLMDDISSGKGLLIDDLPQG